MPVDLRLIDPTREELAAALRKAQASANRATAAQRWGRLERDAAFWGRFAHDCLRERAGRRRSCKSGYHTPEVIAGWWTDPAGRKHFRVIGRTRTAYAYHPPRREGELRGLPPWWHVYPEAVLAVRRPGGETYLACCRCGAVGTPDSLGWMGDACGPCFDRRADGDVPAGGFGHFPGWGGYRNRFAFTADGTRLIGQSAADRLRQVRRGDGGERLGRAVPGNIAEIAGTAGGVLVALSDGTVLRWDDGGPAVPALRRPRVFGRLWFDPGGRRAVLRAADAVFVADLTADAPRYARIDRAPVELLRTVTAAQFSPAGDRILALTTANTVLAVDPTTLATRVVRADVFEAPPWLGYAPELVFAPDGRTVAAVRNMYGGPASAIRMIPAEDQPPRDLHLPAWHRVGALAFAPDGEHVVATAPEDAWVGFWHARTGELVGFVRAVPEDPVPGCGQVRFSPDGRAVAVMCVNHRDRGSTVVVWPWPDVLHAAGGA